MRLTQAAGWPEALDRLDRDFRKLAQEYNFDSPSTATAVMLGRTANGRIEGQGRTPEAIQASAVGVWPA
jgi:hypothetical protein